MVGVGWAVSVATIAAWAVASVLTGGLDTHPVMVKVSNMAKTRRIEASLFIDAPFFNVM